MSTVIGQRSKLEDRIWIALCVMAGLTMFVLLSQPAWRGEEMIAELKSDCEKRHGIILEHKKTFSTSYECASRLDGVQND